MAETVLLMGLPNVGKSVIFNLLTGMNVRAANYCGTTVEFAAGEMKLQGEVYTLVDVPGTYSLNATNEAEAVAVEMLQGGRYSYPSSGGGSHCEETSCPFFQGGKPSAILCVVDAGNLEHSLYLLLQLLQQDLPVVVALNRSDLAREKGYQIDLETLSHELKVPVVPTVAVTGEGIEDLKEVLSRQLSATHKSAQIESRKGDQAAAKEVSWERVERLCQRMWKQEERKALSWREHWNHRLTSPWPGFPLAVVIIGLIFALVVGLGMGLRQYLLLPFFQGLVFPQIEAGVSALLPPGIIQNILIGEYGFLLKGLEWPFALVLPYVISFYIALSFLEDSGYLPRLGILLDGLLNRIGLPGSGVIPLLLGYGCAIPAILSTRALNSHKERVILTSMVCLAVPCISQTGAFIALLSAHSISLMVAVFLLGIAAMIAVALVLNRFLEGRPPMTLMEIPELLLPRGDVLFKKLWLRIKNFLMDGAFPMVIGVAIAAFLYETGLMITLGEWMRPLVVNWLGLPSEASVPLILGILRRELTVLPLMDMDLNLLQLFVGATVALFYVPCIAVVASLIREFKAKMAVGILLMTTVGAFLVGGLFYQLGSLLI